MSRRSTISAVAVALAVFCLAADARAQGRGGPRGGPGGNCGPRGGGMPGMNSLSSQQGTPYATQLQSQMYQSAMRSGQYQQAMMQQTMLQNAILQQMYLQAAEARLLPLVPRGNNAQLGANVPLR